jgi:phage tail-like protein
MTREVLRGLVVTARNYLVVGDVSNRGLLLFDLHSGGNPILQHWPAHVSFAPWDMASTPDGGVLILDREHSRYWKLDCHLRLAADLRNEEEPPFQQRVWQRGKGRGRRTTYTHGYPLRKADGVTPLAEAISIEPGPDGHVLILETDAKQTASTVYEYDGARQVAVYRLEDNQVEIMDPVEGEGVPESYTVIAHDFAYVEDGGTAAQVSNGCNCINTSDAVASGLRHMLYVADHKGKQSFGFRMDTGNGRLLDERAYLPLRRWGGKGIVTVDGQVQYDFEDGRWVPSIIFADCHYVGLGVLMTPANFVSAGANGDGTNGANGANARALVRRGTAGRGQGGESGGRGQAIAPTMDAGGSGNGVNGGSMAVQTQGKPGGQPEAVVPGMPFDSNIAGCVWHRLLVDAQIPAGSAISVRARAADDALLLQVGSWKQQPTLYLRSGGAELPYYDPWHDIQPPPEGAGTWELLFQNIQGRYLQLELTISGTGRSTPALRALRAWYPRFSYLEHYLPGIYQEDALATSFLERWLANVEGLYTNLEDKIEHAALLFDPRTTPADGLEWLACWVGLLLDPLWDEPRKRVLIRNIDSLFRRRGTAFGIEVAVRAYIEPCIDDSLFDPSSRGTGSVRIAEQFLNRDIGGASNGQAYQLASQSAHRFTVLVTRQLSPQELDMVGRIVELEKPAHTTFAINSSWEFFQVGLAQVGQDTLLGEGYRVTQQPLGESYLGDTFLDIPYPENVEDRIVLQRNDLGTLPPL